MQINNIINLLFSIFIMTCWLYLFLVRRKQRKLWNDGKCPIDGTIWQYIGDTNEGRKYKCANDHGIIIFANVEQIYWDDPL